MILGNPEKLQTMRYFKILKSLDFDLKVIFFIKFPKPV